MKSLHTTARDLPPLSATRETPCIAMKMQGSQECMKKENSILKDSERVSQFSGSLPCTCVIKLGFFSCSKKSINDEDGINCFQD